MKPQLLILSLVIIQSSLIFFSFVILFLVVTEVEDFADYVDIAGKNRFHTAIILHELDEFSKGLISESELDLLYDEFHTNILLLKNGGSIHGREISPIPVKFFGDLELVEKKFIEFQNIASKIKEYRQMGEIPPATFYAEHQRVEVELLTASETLTGNITSEFQNIINLQKIFEILLPIINGIVYVITIFVILQTLKKENIHIQKLEKLYTIGQMASRLAHDLRNPITVLKVNLDFLQMKPTSDKTTQDRYDRMQCSIFDMNRIIEDVLEFTKTKDLNLDKHSFLQIIRNSISSITVPNTVDIEIPKEDIEINCDARKLQAVFVNLFINAFDAMENKGKITINLDVESKYILIHIIDSGLGIPDDMMPKMFEPLFTSKNKGTGLGLGICKAIIKQHNGTISVKNNPTTFTIKLPK